MSNILKILMFLALNFCAWVMICWTKNLEKEVADLKNKVNTIDTDAEGFKLYTETKLFGLKDIVQNYESYSALCKRYKLGHPVLSKQNYRFVCQEDNSEVEFNLESIKQLQADEARADGICRERKKNAAK